MAVATAAAISAGLVPVSASEKQGIELLLDNGYEVIAVTDAQEPQIDLVYLRKGKSHVVCKYVPFSPDWSPLGESSCVTINYATE